MSSLDPSLKSLTVEALKSAAASFSAGLTSSGHPGLFAVNDGKAVGTYVEHGFRDYLLRRFDYKPGNSALGIDFPEVSVDLKVTSIRQPQSSSPFRFAEQKVYGLGYNLLVMVYEKSDDYEAREARLPMRHCVFIDAKNTADYQTTRGLREILDRDANKEDVEAFLIERNLPLDEIGRSKLAERILTDRPSQGTITISNALQWRLQYGRAIRLASEGTHEGVEDLYAVS